MEKEIFHYNVVGNNCLNHSESEVGRQDLR